MERRDAEASEATVDGETQGGDGDSDGGTRSRQLASKKDLVALVGRQEGRQAGRFCFAGGLLACLRHPHPHPAATRQQVQFSSLARSRPSSSPSSPSSSQSCCCVHAGACMYMYMYAPPDPLCSRSNKSWTYSFPVRTSSRGITQASPIRLIALSSFVRTESNQN